MKRINKQQTSYYDNIGLREYFIHIAYISYQILDEIPNLYTHPIIRKDIEL